MPDAYTYRLTDIRFADGTELRPGNLTVVVGPNNSGKSRMLKDIVGKTTLQPHFQGVVVDDVQWPVPATLEDLHHVYPQVERTPDERGGWKFATLNPELCSAYSSSGGPEWPDDYRNIIANAGPNSRRSFVDNFGKALVAHLTTEHRLQ